MAVVSRPFAVLQSPRPGAQTTQRRSAGLVVTLAIVAALMSILYLAQTGHVATQGYELEKLDLRKTELVQANQQLQYEIELAQSLDQVRKRAQALGYVPTAQTQVRYITIEVNPARWTAAR